MNRYEKHEAVDLLVALYWKRVGLGQQGITSGISIACLLPQICVSKCLQCGANTSGFMVGDWVAFHVERSQEELTVAGDGEG